MTLQVLLPSMPASVLSLSMDPFGLQVACRLLAPICPHTCEHIWGELLRRPGLVVNAGWPQAPAPDFVLQRAAK